MEHQNQCFELVFLFSGLALSVSPLLFTLFLPLVVISEQRTSSINSHNIIENPIPFPFSR